MGNYIEPFVVPLLVAMQGARNRALYHIKARSSNLFEQEAARRDGRGAAGSEQGQLLMRGRRRGRGGRGQPGDAARVAVRALLAGRPGAADPVALG